MIALTIRPARMDDLEFMRALTPRLADCPLPPWRSPGEVASAEARAVVALLQEPRPDAALLVAESGDGAPLGFVLLETRVDYFTERAHAHLSILAIDAGVEGRGVGRTLLDASETWARTRGLESVTLSVFEHNERARRLYERAGFAPDMVRYLKPLTSQ